MPLSSSCNPDNWGDRDTPWSQTHREITNSNLTDSHHIIQDARINDIAGYDHWAAPAIRLQGPNVRGTEHYIATQTQRIRNYSPYGDLRAAARRALRAAGVDGEDVDDALRRADRYFKGQLCLTDSSIVSGSYKNRP
jgi:hypothetical protein